MRSYAAAAGWCRQCGFFGAANSMLWTRTVQMEWGAAELLAAPCLDLPQRRDRWAIVCHSVVTAGQSKMTLSLSRHRLCTCRQPSASIQAGWHEDHDGVPKAQGPRGSRCNGRGGQEAGAVQQLSLLSNSMQSGVTAVLCSSSHTQEDVTRTGGCHMHRRMSQIYAAEPLIHRRDWKMCMRNLSVRL